MNVLLIVLIIVLLWRVAAGMKKGIVREALALINVLFVALIIGLVCMITEAYHAANYMGIVVNILLIVALSIIYSVVKLVFFPAKIITKLPVLSSADKLLGLVFGVAEALIAFWALCCVLMYMDFGVLKEQLLIMIGESKVLTALYQYNVLGILFEMIKAKVVF